LHLLDLTETVGPIALGTYCVGHISLYRLSNSRIHPSLLADLRTEAGPICETFCSGVQYGD